MASLNSVSDFVDDGGREWCADRIAEEEAQKHSHQQSDGGSWCTMGRRRQREGRRHAGRLV